MVCLYMWSRDGQENCLSRMSQNVINNSYTFIGINAAGYCLLQDTLASTDIGTMSIIPNIP